MEGFPQVIAHIKDIIFAEGVQQPSNVCIGKNSKRHGYR